MIGVDRSDCRVELDPRDWTHPAETDAVARVQQLGGDALIANKGAVGAVAVDQFELAACLADLAMVARDALVGIQHEVAVGRAPDHHYRLGEAVDLAGARAFQVMQQDAFERLIHAAVQTRRFMMA